VVGDAVVGVSAPEEPVVVAGAASVVSAVGVDESVADDSVGVGVDENVVGSEGGGDAVAEVGVDVFAVLEHAARATASTAAVMAAGAFMPPTVGIQP